VTVNGVKKASTIGLVHRAGSSFVLVLGVEGPAMAASDEIRPQESSEWSQYECLVVHRADGGDFRPPRPDGEVGRGAVNYENVVGLVLSVLLALFLFAALLFPERF
jgi:K+-transporting ATPase KdpF subunit